ncbi:MAG: ABC transporter permease subunit [Actinomycetia bacterium]|nr:ABC transporter permease subunit [Actinomycetes bacterium]
MTTTPAPARSSLASLADRASMGRYGPWILLLAGVVILQAAFSRVDEFPALLDTTFSEPIDEFGRWQQSARRTNIMFTGFFTPLSDGVGWALDLVESFLLWVPWFALPVAVFLIVARTRGWRAATVPGVAMLYPGLVGLWEVTIDTLALMTIAVFFSVVIGIPLGIWGAQRPRAEKVMRPALDAMQTIPAPVYFLPMLMLFGVGRVPATFATVIYALPPVVRLTTLGIREVPNQAVEASEMFGARPRQTMLRVQLPMALPTIMAGVTQTIMMALGIVVLATLLGAGGLGQEIMETLSQRRTGRGIATGLAVVAIAIVLDRIGRALVVTDRSSLPSRRATLISVGALIGLVIVGLAAGTDGFPEVWDVKVFDPIDDGVVWIRDNLSWLTRGFSDFVVSRFYVPVRDLLIETIAWPVLLFVGGWLGWQIGGRSLAAFTVLMMAAIGLIGMWAQSLDTLTQVVAAVVLSVAIAVPVGIWAGRNPRIEAALGPVLDALQTIPSLVYIIPAVIFFTVGVVPGIIASVLYAIVPGIRITALAIREVPEESIEASHVFGATARQTMLGVRVPLAAPTIMAGINQVIMMVLAMVIISGLVGGGALGFAAVSAVKRSDLGIGFEVGFAIVAIAMILDRTTQAIAERLRPPAPMH